jgi:hypothetical protein
MTRGAVWGAVLCAALFWTTGVKFAVAQSDLDFELLKGTYAGDFAKIKGLLEKGASPNYLCRSLTPLIVASIRGDEEVVELLVSKGADVSIRGENGPTALMEASLRGSGGIVKLLLEKGANVNAKATFVWTQVRITANSCKELDDAGTVEKLCFKEECCMTALCVASDPAVRQMLLESGGTE